MNGIVPTVCGIHCVVKARDLGLLGLRAAVGGALFAHGAQKLFGWFGGAGLERTGATFDRFGFRPGKLNAIAAGLGEAGGGALLAVGLGTPGASAAVAGTMIVASSMHVDKGFFNGKGGFEYPAVLGWTAACPGRPIEPIVDAQPRADRGSPGRLGRHRQTTPYGSRAQQRRGSDRLARPCDLQVQVGLEIREDFRANNPRFVGGNFEQNMGMARLSALQAPVVDRYADMSRINR